MTTRRSPFAIVSDRVAPAAATKRELLRHVRALERDALSGPGVAFAVACLQDARYLTDATIGVYEELARTGAQVLVLGRGVHAALAPGVQGIDLDDDDPLGDEWTVLLAGRSFLCFVARDLSVPASTDDERAFEWAQTDDPGLVADVHEVLVSDLHLRRSDVPVPPWPDLDPERARASARRAAPERMPSGGAPPG